MDSIEVQGIKISLDWGYDNKYVSISDIARQNSDTEIRILIRSWLKNSSTLIFLNEWEKYHNPNFNADQMAKFMMYAAQNKNKITAQKYIAATDAIGMISKSGRYGGTFAHPDIALNFCYWLSPAFQVYLIKEFQRLKEEEFQLKNLKWHIERITNNIDEVRNLLDTIPHQEEDRNRLNYDFEVKRKKK